MHKHFLLLLAIAIAFPEIVQAQAPPVGPGHCVANCGSGGYRGGGGGGGGNAAAIGSAIGLGLAVGSAIMQQQQMQQQQNSEQRTRQGKRNKPDKSNKSDKPTNEVKKPEPPPSNGSTWSDCTSRGGVWGNSGCGHPTFSSNTGPNSGGGALSPNLPNLPVSFLVPSNLGCPAGFERVEDSIYGGAKCVPLQLQDNAPKGYPHLERRQEINPITSPPSPLDNCSNQIHSEPGVNSSGNVIKIDERGHCLLYLEGGSSLIDLGDATTPGQFNFTFTRPEPGGFRGFVKCLWNEMPSNFAEFKRGLESTGVEREGPCSHRGIGGGGGGASRG